MADAGRHDASVQRLEAEFGASRGQRLNDARDIVADEDEARHLAVRFHGPPQSILSILQQHTMPASDVSYWLLLPSTLSFQSLQLTIL